MFRHIINRILEFSYLLRTIRTTQKMTRGIIIYINILEIWTNKVYHINIVMMGYNI